MIPKLSISGGSLFIAVPFVWRFHGYPNDYFRYTHNGIKKLYTSKQVGGCSKGFYKFYDDYKKEGKLVKGTIGGVEALAIRAKDAIVIETNKLKNNPRYALCSIPTCAKCRTGWKYNRIDIPKYYFLKTIEKLKKKYQEYT